MQEALDALFALAERRGWDLDFHVDETADPAARSLGVIADTALEARLRRPRSWSAIAARWPRQDDGERERVIEKVARAGIAVVSLPMCNMFLQDRHAGRTPRWRGVTALHELKAAGVATMIASDNTRDPFYAYGDLDMLEVWREGVRILHLDYPLRRLGRRRSQPRRRARWGSRRRALRVGEPADMILTHARDFTELFSRPQADRTRRCAPARPLAAAPPAYRDLDASGGSFAMTGAYDIAGFRAAIGDIKVEDNPALVKQKSRDFYWYSPVLKRELEHVDRRPHGHAEKRGRGRAVLAAAYELGVPVTPRGGGTGNYGQAMPLTGGVVLNLTDMNQVKSIAPGRVVCEPGALLIDDRPARSAAAGQELRMYPSTRATASVAGFVAGGSGGVGSINWGGLRDFGNVLRLRVLTMEETPARARTDRRRPAQGDARLRHQRDHHRSRDAAGAALRLGRRDRRLRRLRGGGGLWRGARRAGRPPARSSSPWSRRPRRTTISCATAR